MATLGTGLRVKGKAVMVRRDLLAVLAVLAATVLPPGAFAFEYELGDLTIRHPWARPSIGAAKAGAAYLTIVNQGESADLLIAVASPAAEHVSLHTHLLEGGVAKMRPVAAAEISPGEPAVLQPGGLHVMLAGLKAPLVEGESFPLSLTFERAGTVTVEVTIGVPGSDGGGHGPDRHDGHS